MKNVNNQTRRPLNAKEKRAPDNSNKKETRNSKGERIEMKSQHATTTTTTKLIGRDTGRRRAGKQRTRTTNSSQAKEEEEEEGELLGERELHAQ